MNLHDNLGRYGAGASADSRTRLESVEVREALSARVRRGRRRRAIGGGLGAVAGVALVAVGAFAVVPGIEGDGGGELQPAVPVREYLEDRGVVYELNSVGSVDPETPIDLRLPNKLACGVPFEVVEGVTVHDSSVVDHGVTLASRSAVATLEGPTEEWLRGLNEADREVEWENLIRDNPSELYAVDEQHVFGFQALWQDGKGMTMSTVPLLLRDGMIASIGVTQGGTSDGEGGSEEPWRAWTPAPGACEQGADPGGYFDGTYEPVLVTQIWSRNLQQPLATVVHNAGDIEYTGLGEAPESAVLEPHEQADLLPPEGDRYQAFVVPGPEMSCAPFADQLAVGQPGLHNIQYEVELPGVAGSLTGDLLGRERVVALPDGYDPWYQGLDTWFVAENVDGGRKDPPLKWDGNELWSGFGGSDPFIDSECGYTEPIPDLSGAAFLIIHGVDMDAIEATGLMVSWEDPSDLYTWIYLGQAD